MITLGEQLNSLINEQVNEGKMSVKKLVRGICSRDTFEKMTTGSISTDPRLIKIIIQRLGKSPNKLEYIASKEFIDLVELQYDYDDSIDRRDEKRAAELLERLDSLSTSDCFNSIKEMYRLRNNAAYEYYINEDKQCSLQYINKAIDITLPGLVPGNMIKHAISTVEIENLLFACLLSIELDKRMRWKEYTVKSVLDNIESYALHNVTDIEEQTILFPKIKLIRAYQLVKEGMESKAAEVADKGLELLRERRLIHMTLPLLDIIERYGRTGRLRDSYGDYIEYKNLIEKLIKKERGPHVKLDAIFLETDRALYHYEGEVYRGQRQIMKFTQEETAERVDVSPDVISRYEMGKRSPRRKNFLKLMDVLKLDYSKQGTFLICDDFKLLEDERLIHSLIMKESYDQAEKKIDELGNKLGSKYRNNKIIVTVYRNQIELRTRKKEAQKVLDQDLDLLRQVYPCMEEDMIRTPFFAENALIIQICTCLELLERKDEAFSLCNKIIELYDKSYVSKRLQQRTWAFLLINLMRLTKDISFAEQALLARLMCRSGTGLENILSAMAVRLYSENKLLSKELAKQSLIAAKLMKTANVPRLEEFIEKWYSNLDDMT